MQCNVTDVLPLNTILLKHIYMFHNLYNRPFITMLMRTNIFSSRKIGPWWLRTNQDVCHCCVYRCLVCSDNKWITDNSRVTCTWMLIVNYANQNPIVRAQIWHYWIYIQCSHPGLQTYQIALSLSILCCCASSPLWKVENDNYLIKMCVHSFIKAKVDWELAVLVMTQRIQFDQSAFSRRSTQ